MRQLLRERMRMAVTREVGFAGDVVDLALFVDGELVLEDGRLAGLLARPVERTLSDETASSPRTELCMMMRGYGCDVRDRPALRPL